MRPRRVLRALAIALGSGAGLVSLATGTAAQTDPHTDLDPLGPASACLVCHDGVLAPKAVGHAVEVDYAEILQMQPGALRPVVELPFFEGRVVCTTCHDLETGTGVDLRVPAGRLCTACHLL